MKLSNYAVLRVLVVAAVVFLSSCASILNPSHQTVTIKTGDSSNKVYIDSTLVGTGTAVVTKVERDMACKQVKIEAPGYEPEYYAFMQNKKSPLYCLSVIPFGVFFYPIFYDSGPKAQNYNKESREFVCTTPIKDRAEGEKYIYLNKASFTLESDDMKMHRISAAEYYRDPVLCRKVLVSTNNESVKFDNTIFAEQMNAQLKERGYSDTTNSILKNHTNTLYVDVDVQKLELNTVYRTFVNAGVVSFMYAEVTVNWQVMDVYKQVKYEVTETVRSGEFAGVSYGFFFAQSGEKQSKVIDNIIDNAMRKSLFQLLTKEELAEILKIDENIAVFENMTIAKPTKVASTVPEAMSATVTVKAGDGHGSGFFVSPDGYIITNFHVVAGDEDDLEVVMHDGSKVKAEVVRKNELDDLALLKVDKKVGVCFDLNNPGDKTVGSDIFVIGTPSSIELTQTLSKGIISGTRKVEDNEILQTDASINPGNSGGPMITKSAQIIGVVNAKVVGVGVEGIGFAIPATRVLKSLSITLQ